MAAGSWPAGPRTSPPLRNGAFGVLQACLDRALPRDVRGFDLHRCRPVAGAEALLEGYRPDHRPLEGSASSHRANLFRKPEPSKACEVLTGSFDHPSDNGPNEAGSDSSARASSMYRPASLRARGGDGSRTAASRRRSGCPASSSAARAARHRGQCRTASHGVEADIGATVSTLPWPPDLRHRARNRTRLPSGSS